jgi:ADP-ribosylglycohydrolase
MAVNLGDDADTTGAIYGQIAGAYYGDNVIPIAWRNMVTKRDSIIAFGEKLAYAAYTVTLLD